MASPALTSKLGAELEWLQRTLRRLRATISDAEQIQTQGKIFAVWLQDMKDIACDAEDLIDEFEYEDLRRRIEGERSRGRSTGSSSGKRSMMCKVHDIKRRLGDIGKYKNRLGIGDVDGRADQELMRGSMQQTGSLPTESEIFGREKEKEEILRFLLAPDDDSVVSTIAITGMGGLGKTTLAQLVYNDRRVVEHFKPRMWIWTASDYDVMELTREILGSIDLDIKLAQNLRNLDVYQRAIVDKLEGKQFLLVLDNLWDRNQKKWQSLVAPLMYGTKKGSKILITTRDTGLANILQFRKTVELEGLPFDDCCKLFERHAFFDGTFADYPRLEAIGKQIVDKFKGVPLAVAVVGDVLRSTLEVSEWRRILETEIWEIDEGEDGILSVLKLSYERLPPQLKQCLAYCSLFPKNQRFDRFDLVQQWMAQGFVQSERWGRVEDVGNRCFNDLFTRSFFQLVDRKYVLHDLIRDLAMLVSHRDHRLTDPDGLLGILGDNHSVRHLSLQMTSRWPDLEDLEKLLACRYLRTLVFCFLKDSQWRVPPRSLFRSLGTLRLLDLSCGGIKELPDSIGNLRHLRYLDLGSNAIRTLPESLCCLYRLETLKLKGCNHIDKLPQGIGHLINLRHLEVDAGSLSEVVGFGNLTCLQELKSFPISKRGHGPKIDDLKDMNQLRGSLCIQNLGLVRSKEEAMGAMLDRKQHLLMLKMEWDASHISSREEEILETLVPPSGLKELAIEGYHGENAPTWLEQQSLSYLESISLKKCRNWSSLPISLGMRRIDISGCPKLRYLPSLPATLKELVIYDVGLEELPEFYQPAQPVPESGNNIIPTLSFFKVDGCDALKSLRGGLLRHHLRNLTVLRIQHCHQLVEWPEGGGFPATLLSLQEELCIEDCPKLEAFPAGVTLSPSLKHLVVTGSPDVVNQALLAQLHNLPSGSSVSVEKDYTDLASCYEQVFKLVVADWMVIGDIRHFYFRPIRAPEDGLFLRLTCGKRRVWSWRSNDWVHAWRVQICPRSTSRWMLDHLNGSEMIFVLLEEENTAAPTEEWWVRRSPPQEDSLSNHLGIFDDDTRKHHEQNWSVGAAHHHLPWASSIRWLVVEGTFHETLLPFRMDSLEGLWISRFRGAMALLPDALLYHLTELRELQIFDCPELTLSSLKEVISSLPSLQHLTIKQCPKLSKSSSVSLQHLTKQCPKLSKSSSLSRIHSSSTSLSNAAKLRTIFVDDAKLLGDAQFVHDCLSSLRGLHIWGDENLTSLTPTMQKGLRRLGQSLQHLSFNDCDQLELLPSDMRSLLPSLKALSIKSCDSLCYLPMGGLPASLDILVFDDRSQEFAIPYMLPPSPRPLALLPLQLLTIARIPVIVSNGRLVKGSYREFLEFREKWRDF